MFPFYFGSANKHIYGVHHEASGDEYRDEAILFCCPVSHEYMRTHWFLKLLCEKLSSRGYHCLRFDYYGTGDSSGSFLDADIDEWIQNVVAASDEIKELSGCTSVSMIGVRLGAMLSALASEVVKPERVVLWDPVVDGQVYLSELETLHKEMIQDRSRFKHLPASNDEEIHQILGYQYNDNLFNSIANKKFGLSKIRANQISVVTGKNNHTVLKNNKDKQPVNISYIDSNVESDWLYLDNMEKMFFSDRLSDVIVDLFIE